MQRVKIGFFVFIALIIGFVYSSETAYSELYIEKVYYVSVDGSDENPGTLKAPWRTIQKAANTLVAGETVLVRGGVYEEFVHIRRSGSATEGFITFRAYPGERPILEGKNLKPSDDHDSLLLISKASFIAVHGFEIRGLSTYSANHYISGFKVNGGGSYISIINNNIHSISNHSSNGNAHGLVVYGDSITPISNIIISGNEVHHLVSGSSESLTLDGNVKDFVITYNKVHDNNNIGIDIIGHYNTCPAPCIDQARNGIVSNNVVYNIDTASNPAYGGLGHRAAAGIYVDGGTNIIVENNEVYNSNFGVELASEIYGKTTSNVILRNNFLHHNHGAGIIMGGSGIDNGGSRQNVVIHNKLYMNDTMDQGYGEITLQNYNVDNIFANNMISTSSKKKFIQNDEMTGSGNIMYYNSYYYIDKLNPIMLHPIDAMSTVWNAFKTKSVYNNSMFGKPLAPEKNGVYFPIE